MNVLGIETSCDETSVAVLKFSQGQIKLAAHLVSSQVKLHARWGGVVPELAARRHTEVIIPLLDTTLKKARTTPAKIDLIAVAAGPGLITALQVGVETAKTLALAWKKPLVGVNHIAGHLVSPFLATSSWPLANRKTTWPAVALVVSGGHTELHLIKSLGQQRLLGRTLDDAAGEAFDKTAKLLKLPYPGGPQVAKLARLGDPTAFVFPRPLIKNSNYDFSFAGLKTAVLYQVQKLKNITPQTQADLCASFQNAAVEVLVSKTLRAAREHKAKTIIVAGGVSANHELQKQLTAAAKLLRPAPGTLFPDSEFTGDNAAMIALAGAIEANKRGLKPYKNGWRTTQAQANWELWQ
ncbi:MAG: tRNA (adenosine(37)-N6)-threonylcarbamoyltransferase complex transferase subunit TsaD [Candidatus Veblenbacteria bacterium]|nr:tRNA (adenosine(37)-N6)-threonylcarbamoyltransferase complex transferase subunit TsaD [Candidatus Veblenbacteria bacterium]MDZ4229835.1 tRNA (adenosine(37)-N6)-threonylcarbamoyltransferase complex transferase subunit TsaD [Candidatus Veblenbacteria bacterium]